MASLETKLQNEINKLSSDPAIARIKIPKNVKIIGTQVPLYSPAYMFTNGAEYSFKHESANQNGVIGRIDLVFSLGQRTYVCEIKDSDPKKYSFWYATKALAYCEYLKWQSGNSKYRPAILVPNESLRLEHQLIAGKLGITIFTFSLNDGYFSFKPIDDRPHWKQSL